MFPSNILQDFTNFLFSFIVIYQRSHYNDSMRINYLHNFEVTPQQARDIQISLAKKVIESNHIQYPKLIAGIDVSINQNYDAAAAIVVLSYPDLKIVEIVISKGKVKFPYIPGLLSFREIPLTLEICAKLKSDPDIVMVDGQGIAHPRRIGLASHLGLFLNKTTIGCAKSPLFGSFSEPENIPGSYSQIKDNDGSTIGAVLRTKLNVKPLYISVGHKIDLQNSIQWVLNCCQGYRIPEPTRLAHLASKGNLC
jgi:deoxyribonuclease V